MPQNYPRNGRISRLPLEQLPAGLVARAHRLARLRDRLVAALDEEEASHVAGVSADKGKLVIFADSSAWCTRLRYRTGKLEAAAAALLGRRQQISFRVQLPQFRRRESPRRELSTRVRATLAAAARSIEAGGTEGIEDEGNRALATALRRLADSEADTEKD
ncbi:MAG: DciA family protein [Gammaproteobacteria bacterium]